MNKYMRGNPINLPASFSTIDPLTAEQTLADPTTVTFTILNPDIQDLAYVYGVDTNVTRPQVGVYICALDPQLPVGVYHYRVEGTGAVEATREGFFEVEESSVLTPDAPTMPVEGPCGQWISGADVANCVRLDYNADSCWIFDTAAFNASAVLYEVSGRQFPGSNCVRTVRPCSTTCGCWGGPLSAGFQPWWWSGTSWGYGGAGAWGPWGWYDGAGARHGCSPKSRVKLSGYPVYKIESVTIDGDELPEFDADTGARNWRLDGWRWLVRMDAPGPPVVPQFWPGCQNRSLDADQPGTFEVAYRWGAEVPGVGAAAAIEVAQQLYLACGGADCILPAGVTRVVRQGIEIDRSLLANWMDPKKQTGLVNLDAFLAAYWSGQRGGRRTAIFSPDVQQFARRVGT